MREQKESNKSRHHSGSFKKEKRAAIRKRGFSRPMFI
jgi:hypothetical protein